jgi:hypothetical protein
MLGLLLLTIGGVFALIFILNVLIRTLRRGERITFADTLLAFMALLVPLAALVVDNLDTVMLDTVESGALVLAGVLFVFSLLITIIEVFRPQRLRASRGVFGLGMGALLAISALAVPYLAVYVYEAAKPPPLPTPINVTPNADDQRFRAFFASILQIVAEETGLDSGVVLEQLRNERLSVEQLVAANGGDFEVVVQRITDLMYAQIEALVDDGRITPVQAAGAILLIPNLVRTSLSNDLDSLQQFFNRGQPTPSPREATEDAATFEAFFTVTATYTATPSPTFTATPTATASRTPRPTASPSATRQRYLTRTPTLTPTLPNPCLAVMNYNVNLRTAPNLDAELVTTIPFETAVTVFGRSEDSQWWFVNYNGQAGWVKGEFIILSASCQDLPVRED